jgi:hypothetical protein
MVYWLAGGWEVFAEMPAPVSTAGCEELPALSLGDVAAGPLSSINAGAESVGGKASAWHELLQGTIHKTTAIKVRQSFLRSMGNLHSRFSSARLLYRNRNGGQILFFQEAARAL